MIQIYIAHCQKNNEHDKARLLAEYGVNKAFGLTSALCHDEKGKPYFESDSCIFVSISHSGKFCVAALSDGEIGVDIEPMNGDEKRLLRLADRYFTRDEYEYVLEDTRRRFYEVWCAKESYVKYTGKGLSQGLSRFSILNLQGIDENIRFSRGIYEDNMIAICSEEVWSGELTYIEI